MSACTETHGAALRRRLARARRQRGAAVFIVSLVVTLLATLGMFAARSASLSAEASGYNRQLTQTHFATDYAVSVVAADMLRNAPVHAKLMSDPNKMDKTCVGYAKLIRPTCKLYGYSYLENEVVQSYETKNALLVKNAPGLPGSLGPTDIEADFKIELSDLHDAWPPFEGSQTNTTDAKPPVPKMMTVTVEGQVRPKKKQQPKDPTAAIAAGVETVRAHMVVGPIWE